MDDASTDSSADEIDAAGAFRVGHPANLGAGGALQTGIEAALAFTEAEYIACFDADGQHRVQDLLGMIQLIREGHDVVIGSRFLEGGATEMPWLRRHVLRAATALMNRRGRPGSPTPTTACASCRRSVAQEVRLTYSGMAYASQLEKTLTSSNLRITEFPVTILYTAYSQSKGQPLLNSVNILAEVAARRISHWSFK